MLIINLDLFKISFFYVFIQSALDIIILLQYIKRKIPDRQGDSMFDHIKTSHYGRSVKQYHNWSLTSFAVNRLYYIHSGNLTVLLDNAPYALKPGFIYLIPQNLKFELLLTPETRVDHTFLDFVSLPAVKMDGFIEIDPSQHPLIQQAAQILFSLTERYPTYMCDDHTEFIPLVESYLENTLFLINREFPIHTIADTRINLALEYIHQHYDQEITLETLTELTNLEKNYFIRLFKQYMNLTPYQYIKKYRFNAALALIKRRYSLSDVALKIGYSDISAFSHAFQRIYGIYPSEIARNTD